MVVFEKWCFKKRKNGSVLSFVVLMTFVLSLLGASLLGLGVNARMEECVLLSTDGVNNKLKIFL